MSEAVVEAAAHPGHCGCGGLEQTTAQHPPGTVMRHQQHIGTQAVAHGAHQHALPQTLQIAREQEATVPTLHRKHAGGGVAAVPERGRVQVRETHSVPFPDHAGLAGRLPHNGLTTAAQDLPHRQAGCNGRDSPTMVHVLVADQNPLDAAHAVPAQRRQDHRRPRIKAVFPGWSSVVHEGVPARVDDHRKPLPDVQHLGPELALGDRWRQGQCQRQAGQSHPGQKVPCAREQKQDHPQSPQNRARPGHGHLRDRARYGKNKLQHPQQQREPGICPPQQRAAQGCPDQRQACAGEQHRQHHEADDKHRHQVGHRRDPGAQLEPGETGRQQGDGQDDMNPQPPFRPRRVNPSLDQDQDHRHGAEGEPEAGGEDAGGCDRHHADQSTGIDAPGKRVAPCQDRYTHEYEHDQRPLRRNAEARERGAARAVFATRRVPATGQNQPPARHAARRWPSDDSFRYAESGANRRGPSHFGRR